MVPKEARAKVAKEVHKEVHGMDQDRTATSHTPGTGISGAEEGGAPGPGARSQAGQHHAMGCFGLAQMAKHSPAAQHRRVVPLLNRLGHIELRPVWLTNRPSDRPSDRPPSDRRPTDRQFSSDRPTRAAGRIGWSESVWVWVSTAAIGRLRLKVPVPRPTYFGTRELAPRNKWGVA